MKRNFIPSESETERILVRGVNWLGDAVMTTPALSRLRERFPNAHIAVLTHEKLFDVWRHHPTVNDVIPFRDRENVFSVGRRLHEFRFDLALVLPNSPRSALEVWAARIPRRVGYSRSWRNWLLTHCVADRDGFVPTRKRKPPEVRRLIANDGAVCSGPRPPATAHQIHHYLHLAAALGASPRPLPPHLHLSRRDIAAAMQRHELSTSTRWFALSAGAQYGPAKCWPHERFAAVAREIQKRVNCRWAIVGGKEDQETAAAVASQVPGALNLAGRTTLTELFAILKISRILLANDSGPAHVAAALDTPVVALYGSTLPELTAPGLAGDPRHRFLRGTAACAPCFLRECPVDSRCLKSITVNRVTQSVLEALEMPVAHPEPAQMV